MFNSSDIYSQWELPRSSTELPKPFTFPPPDLAEDLISNYFIHINLHVPLLHRPTFQEEVKRDLHHFHVGFACVYLLVCSIGARFSNDPRILVDGQESLHSAGWKWFQQVATVQNPLPITPPTLYDVQSYAVSPCSIPLLYQLTLSAALCAIFISMFNSSDLLDDDRCWNPLSSGCWGS